MNVDEVILEGEGKSIGTDLLEELVRANAQ